GEDGTPTYTWVRYADDSQGNGMSNFPVGKKYIGLAHNKSTEVESTDPADYIWSLIKGDRGEKGEPGFDGVSTYTHIAYANSADGTVDFSTTDSTGRSYIGMYVDYRSAGDSYNWKHDGYAHPAQPFGHYQSVEPPEDSQDPIDYKWSLIKGRDGEQGIPGPKGEDGHTPYFHVAYANSADGTVDFHTSDSSGKTYIGQYTDFEQNDSTNPKDYKWSKIKGDKGDQGPNKVDQSTEFE